jgi:hypothetical protein
MPWRPSGRGASRARTDGQPAMPSEQIQVAYAQRGDHASDAAGGGPFAPVPASSAGGGGDRVSLAAWDRLACPARADRALAVGVEAAGAVQRRGRVGQDPDRRGTSVSHEPADRQRHRKRRVARERSVTIATSIKAATLSNALSSSNKGEDGVQARQAGHALLWRRGLGRHPHLPTTRYAASWTSGRASSPHALVR